MTTNSWLGRAEPTPIISQAHTYWEPRVVATSNFLNNGKQVAGVAGRLFLFGPDGGHPLKGDGTVSVDMFDATSGPPAGDAKPIVHIEFDKDSLRELCRKDVIGWGYTLYIPWEQYSPAVTRLQMRVCFHQPKGSPLFAPPSTITIKRD